jgi:hypothetical protein
VTSYKDAYCHSIWNRLSLLAAHPKHAIFLFVLAIVFPLTLATHSTYAGSGDEPHYLVIAHSIAFDHDFDLSNNYGANEPLIADGTLQPELHALPGVHNVLRPAHDVGMPMLLSPVIRIAAPVADWVARVTPAAVMTRLRLTPSGLYRHLLEVVMAFIGGMLAVLLFDSLILSGTAPGAAFWYATLLALSPPLLIYSILFFTEIVTAFLCLAAFRIVALEDKPHTRTWLLAGLATGFLLLVHVRNIGLVAGLSLIAVTRLTRERDWSGLAAFGGPVAFILSVRTALNFEFWGTYVTTPQARSGGWGGWSDLAGTAVVRLSGLLVDQEFGLLPYGPIFIIAIAGIAFWPDNRAASRRIAVVAGAYLIAVLLSVTNAHGWTGGWSPPARFMMPIVPLLALGLPPGVRLFPRAVVIAVIVSQVVLNLYFWQHPKNLWNDGDGRAAICHRGGVSVCAYLPAIHQR